MKILISGASGFIGRNLKNFLMHEGFSVDILDRSELHMPNEKIEWADVVVNLAGAPIIKRWTKSYKEKIYDSRILTTKLLIDAVRNANNKPKVFISTSAVGIYSSQGIHDESSNHYNNSFLGKVCKDWEEEALKAYHEVRVVIFRLGIVLGKNGGAFPKMVKPFKLGFGGNLGSGEQSFSWIHLHDLLQAYKTAITKEQFKGIYNLTAPQTVANKDFTGMLSSVLHKPSFFNVPSFILKLTYGKASEMLLTGQAAMPNRLLHLEFEYKYPKLNEALKELLD